MQEKGSGRNSHYKMTSTAMLWLQTNKPGSGTMNLGGSLTRQVGRINLIVLRLNVTNYKIYYSKSPII